MLLTAGSPRDSKGVRKINQKVSNLDYEYRNRISVIKQEEDFDSVWANIHKQAGK
jgi:hypothetical protein